MVSPQSFCSLLPQGESEFMVDEIELAEEAHRLRREYLSVSASIP